MGDSILRSQTDISRGALFGELGEGGELCSGKRCLASSAQELCPALAWRSASSALCRPGEAARLGGEAGLGRKISQLGESMELFLGERVDDCLVADLFVMK